ncbi:MAG: hypothetical protein P5690_26175, partial [Limnospira sp. PMC 1236.20]|nr:hypothetical protein [Limnospira sp. PMC 1280.21]MDT9262725.1 hypothetical protein [Limnospira sp. PMC 1236.20]
MTNAIVMGWSGRTPYILPRGRSPTRRLFQALQLYFTPKRLAQRGYCIAQDRKVRTYNGEDEMTN